MTTLVSSLQLLRRCALTRELPRFPVSALTAAVQALGDGPTAESQPPSERLALLLAKITGQLSSGVQVVELSTSEWLDAPWIAFERWEQRALCECTAFYEGLLTAAKTSAHIGRRCIYVYLRDYDPFAPMAGAPLASIIRASLGEAHALLSAWAERHQRLKMFASVGGPAATLAGMLSQAVPNPLTSRLGEAGLTGAFAHGGFSFGLLLAWCGRAHERVWENQEVIEEWIRTCSGAVTGREYRVVESLLAPWRSADPAADWRKPLLAWLQRRYGDPEKTTIGLWPQVASDLRAVAVRWLTLQTIEGFFDALDDYAHRRGDEAMRRQWPYRREFWLAYYRRGVVIDAKAAVGRDMEESLGWRWLQAQFGNRVARLEAPDSSLSALLLRLRGIVVFVGTHNASCRAWDETSAHAPKMIRSKYRYSEILTDPRTDLQIDPHASSTGLTQAGAEFGTWQRKMREFLRRKIGVTVSESEYMP